MWKQFFFSRDWAPIAWVGTAVILGGMQLSVHIDVLINEWMRQFWNLVSDAIHTPDAVPVDKLYVEAMKFSKIAGVGMLASVVLSFLTQHWTFRWRQAITEYYTRNWPQLRSVEGASQRIQEDTMKWSRTIEGLGESLVQSILQLIAFMPVLARLSKDVTTVPLFGHVDNSLCYAALLWSVFGTLLLALVGIKLPGLEFQNQRVEAAYRKELVLGEEDSLRASEEECRGLFGSVRKNYFKIYMHYMYFNVAKYSYLQFDAIFPVVLLAPTICAGKIELGEIHQILSAFHKVGGSFQFLVRSWSTIIDLISIYKRLKAFESILKQDAAGTSKVSKAESEAKAQPSAGNENHEMDCCREV